MPDELKRSETALPDATMSHSCADKRRWRAGWVWVALGAVIGGLSILSYSGPGETDMPPNPFSSEYGSILHIWFGFFATALVALLAAAIWSRGLMRAIGIGLLVVVCAANFVPAAHFLRYFSDLR
jgi:hypothetical protein